MCFLVALFGCTRNGHANAAADEHHKLIEVAQDVFKLTRQYYQLHKMPPKSRRDLIQEFGVVQKAGFEQASFTYSLDEVHLTFNAAGNSKSVIDIELALSNDVGRYKAFDCSKGSY